MKKIISMIILATIICCFSLTAFAAAPSLTFENKTIEVGTAAEEVTLNFKINFTEATEIASIAFKVKGSTGVTIKAVDVSALTAVIPQSSMTDAAAFYYSFCDDNMSVLNYAFSGEYIVPVTVEVDATAETEYTVGFEAQKNMIMDSSFATIASDANFPTATITVEAAGPEYENVDTKIADLVADPSDLVAEDGTKFTNVAKYTGSFNLTDIKNGLDIAGGEELLKVGFKKNDGAADTFSSIAVSGTGTVEYSFLFYGIEDASVLDIDTYYTAKRIKATN